MVPAKMLTINVLVTTMVFLNMVFHLNGYKLPSQIVFPGSSSIEREIFQGTEIPLNLIRQLNNVSSIRELLDNLIEPPVSENEEFSLAARLGHDEERGSIREGKSATCMPELKTISLKPDRSRTTFYYPSCTRVERCGGCCSHHLLSCQPTEYQYFPMTIVVADYLGGNKLRFRGRKIIEVEAHKKCKCDCKIRPQDCSRYQRYNPDKCQCECANYEDEIRCNSESPMKMWSKESCSCMCREEMECSFGSYFDPFTCSKSLSVFHYSCTGFRSRRKPTFLYNVDQTKGVSR
ncbi:hypothetical protein RUM44_007715 [Polyplax serrata]|uniref:Platelet-derived growth factor (PDGF) family profile domain-containing protein n=1 Tax=Polyplax serrata TaxID=468196 RepID=A0ABR1BAQ0_POLSC